MSFSWSVGQCGRLYLLLWQAGRYDGAVWAELTEIANNGRIIIPVSMTLRHIFHVC
jgi:hypothetical protein